MTAEQIIIVDQNGNPVETKFADDPTVPTSTVVVTVCAHFTR